MRSHADGRSMVGGEDSAMPVTDSGRLGPAHRLARLAIAGVLLGFAFACPFAARLGPPMQWVSALAGAMLLVTAATGSCPVIGLLRRRSGV
jgi:hypothetical protein